MALTEVLAALGMPAAWLLTTVRSLLADTGLFGAEPSWAFTLALTAIAARALTVPLWAVAVAGRRNELVSLPIRCGILAEERFSSREAAAERVRLERIRPLRAGVRLADRLVVTLLTASLVAALIALYQDTAGSPLIEMRTDPDSPVVFSAAGWQLTNADSSPVRILVGGLLLGGLWWAALNRQDRLTRTQALAPWVLRWDATHRRPWLTLPSLLAVSVVLMPFGALAFVAVWELAGMAILPMLLRPNQPPPQIAERYFRYDKNNGTHWLRVKAPPAPAVADRSMAVGVVAASAAMALDSPTEEIPVIDAPLAEDPVPAPPTPTQDSPLRAAPRTSPLLPDDPQRIGGYELRQRLGSGGMGTVYVARDPWANTDVALKTVASVVLGGQKELARFQREADTLALIDNAFTVRILGSGIDRQRPYMVMELLDGMTLDDYVYEIGPITDPELLRAVGLALALALSGLHRHDMVHRDIKPSNLMLTSAGPKLIDFGIVHMQHATRLTRTGTHLGTMAYMAPEQFRGAHVNPAADVWAWGCLLVIAGTGHGPFDAPDIASITRKILMDPPDQELLDYMHRIDPAFGKLVASTLDKDPTARPANGTELLARMWPGDLNVRSITEHVMRVWGQLA